MGLRTVLSSVFGSLDLAAPLLQFRVTRRSTAEVDPEPLAELFGKLLLKYRWAFQVSPQRISTERQRMAFQRQTGGLPLPMSLSWQDEVARTYQGAVLSLMPEQLWLPTTAYLVVDPARSSDGPVTTSDLTAQVSSLFAKAGLVCEQVEALLAPVSCNLWKVQAVKLAGGLPVPEVVDVLSGALASGAATLFWAHNPPEGGVGELNRVSLHIGLEEREGAPKARAALDSGGALTIEPLGGLRQHEKAWRVVDFLGQETGLAPVSLLPMTTILHPADLDRQDTQVPVGTADGFPQALDIGRNTLILAEPGAYEGVATLQLGAIHAVTCGLQVLLITPPAADNRFLRVIQALTQDCPVRAYTTEDFQGSEWPPLGGSGGPVLNLLTPATRDANASQVIFSVLKDLPERGGLWWVGIFEFAARTPEEMARSGRPISASMPQRQAHMEAVQSLILEGPPQGVIVAYRSDPFTLDANSGMMARAKEGLQDIWALPGPSARYLRVFMYPEDKVAKLQPKLAGAGREFLAVFQPWRQPPRLVDLRQGPLAGPLFNPGERPLWEAPTWPMALPRPEARVEQAAVRVDARQRYFAGRVSMLEEKDIVPIPAPQDFKSDEPEIEPLATPQEFADMSLRLLRAKAVKKGFGADSYAARQLSARGFSLKEVEDLLRQGRSPSEILDGFYSQAEIEAGLVESEPEVETPEEPVVEVLHAAPISQVAAEVVEPATTPQPVLEAAVIEVDVAEIRKELKALGLNAKQVQQVLEQMDPAGVQKSLGNGWRKKHWEMYLRGEEPAIVDLAAMSAMTARSRS